MVPRIEVWIGREPAAEAKKAGIASQDTLLIPSSPILIGREANVHCSSVSDVLRIRSMPAGIIISQELMTMTGGAPQYVYEPWGANGASEN